MASTMSATGAEGSNFFAGAPELFPEAEALISQRKDPKDEKDMSESPLPIPSLARQYHATQHKHPGSNNRPDSPPAPLSIPLPPPSSHDYSRDNLAVGHSAAVGNTCPAAVESLAVGILVVESLAVGILVVESLVADTLVVDGFVADTPVVDGLVVVGLVVVGLVVIGLVVVGLAVKARLVAAGKAVDAGTAHCKDPRLDGREEGRRVVKRRAVVALALPSVLDYVYGARATGGKANCHPCWW